MAYLCGDEGFVNVGVTRLDVTNWTASENAELDETTNTASAGFKENITCKKSMTGTVEANFDAALGPKAAPDISAGDLIALDLNTGAAGQYDLSAHVTRLNWTNPAGNAVTYSFDFESTGPYAYTP